jgi:hypothetical protein
MSTTVKIDNIVLIADYNGLTIRKGIFKRVFVTWATLEFLAKEGVVEKMEDRKIFQIYEPLSGLTVQDGLEFTVLTTHGRVDMMKGTAMGLIPIVKSLYGRYRWYKH